MVESGTRGEDREKGCITRGREGRRCNDGRKRNKREIVWGGRRRELGSHH
jgi:hypothetical protein